MWLANGGTIPYNANCVLALLHRGVYAVTLVDVSDISTSLFIIGVVFLLLIFGLLSLGILRMFQQRFRYGWVCFAGAVVSFIVLMIILNKWYV